MGGLSPRHMRAFHNLGLVTGGSRLARRPQRLPEPDIRPDITPPCVPPDPLTIHDNFDRPSYSPDPLLHGSTTTSGHTWTDYRGIFKVDLRTLAPYPANSAAYNFDSPGGFTTGPAFTGFDYGSTDAHLAVRVVGSGTSSGATGIFLCFDGSAHGSPNNFYRADTNGQLLKTTPSGTTTMTTFVGAPRSGAVFEVVKSGADFEVFWDGVSVATVTDGGTLITGTKHGLTARFDSTAGAWYDWGYPYNPCDPDPLV